MQLADIHDLDFGSLLYIAMIDPYTSFFKFSIIFKIILVCKPLMVKHSVVLVVELD